MRKRKIHLTGVIVLAVIAAGLEGCASPTMRKEQAVRALENKYKEKFEIVSYRETGFLEDFYTVQAYSVEYPDLIFRASVDNESGEVMDSYVTKRLCDRISNKISLNLKTLENDYYVFTEAMLGDTVLSDPNVSLEEYLKEAPGNKFTIYLSIDQKNSSVQGMVKSLNRMLNDITEISGSVCIYLTDEELLTKIQEYVTSHDDTYSDFDEMTENAYIGSIDFENTCFSITEDTMKKMAGDRL